MHTHTTSPFSLSAYYISLVHVYASCIAIVAICILFFRRRVEFGLLQNPTSNISDDYLVAVIREIKVDSPCLSVQMICGSLRSRGLHITRERVHSTLQAIDPLGETGGGRMV